MFALKLTIEGATEQEMRKGLEAARVVFEKAGVHPLIAAEGWWKLQGWDDGAPDESLTEEDSRNAAIWLDAEDAAIEACCKGWEEERRPVSGVLQMIDTERFATRREEDGTWTILDPLTEEPVRTLGGGELSGLDDDEMEEALELLEEGLIEREDAPDASRH